MPDEPVPTLGQKEYEVIRRQPVLGVETGGTLTLDLTAEQEQFYLDGGHLKIATAKSGAKKEGGNTDG